MPKDWGWDVTLFAGTAAHYERGRLPYAPGLTAAVAAILPPGARRLLDVGCGPGTLSLRLAGLFDRTVGIDPDPGMVDEARRRAAASGVGGVEFRRARAEDLPMDLGRFDVVAFGQSFHWMDQDRVAAAVYDMLPPDGLFLHVSDDKEAPPRDRAGITDPPPPDVAIAELVREFLGPVRRAGRGLLPHGTPGGEAAVLARHGFVGPDRIIVAGGQVLSRGPDDVVAWVHSRSESAPQLFGPDLAAFDARLRELLAASSSSGLFAEHVPDTALTAWRRPPAPSPSLGHGPR